MKKYLIILEFSILIILFKIIITDNENNASYFGLKLIDSNVIIFNFENFLYY